MWLQIQNKYWIKLNFSIRAIVSMSKNQINYDGLAEEPHLQDYEQKPIENYGLSLLKGMGFTEARGIGKSKANQRSQILVLKARPRGLGLGAETQEQIQKETFVIGDRVKIVAEQHEGLFGFISSLASEQVLEVELYPSNSKVKVKASALKKLTKQQMEDLKKKFKTKDEQGEKKKKKRLKWIVPQIRVKIIDQKSEHYLKKVIVSELISERQFQCRDQSGKIFLNLQERDVQTCVPKVGGTVLILKGERLGSKATVLEKKKGKNKVTIQTVEELEVLKLSQDDVAQYIQV